MGKSRRGSKEFSREQKLIHENKRLKREVSSLRKQLARLDLDRFNTVREMIEDAHAEVQASVGKEVIETLKKAWACKECNEGYLEIILFNKLSDTWYYRACNSCSHRTKSQKYDPNRVKGIVKESKEE